MCWPNATRILYHAEVVSETACVHGRAIGFSQGNDFLFADDHPQLQAVMRQWAIKPEQKTSGELEILRYLLDRHTFPGSNGSKQDLSSKVGGVPAPSSQRLSLGGKKVGMGGNICMRWATDYWSVKK